VKEISLEGSAEATQTRDRFDVLACDGQAVLVSEHVLEQDPQRVRKPIDVETLLERLQSEDLDVPTVDGQLPARSEGVRMSHLPRFKQLRLG